MKLICDGLELSDAIGKVSKALPQRVVNPVLEGIKITAEGETLTLYATDSEFSVERKINAEIIEEGEILVPGRIFSDYIKKLTDEQIELSETEKNRLRIRYNESEGYLQCLDKDDYPDKADINREKGFHILESELKDVINKTLFSASTDDSRQILKGCLFEIDEYTLTVVALDGYRLALAKKALEQKKRKDERCHSQPCVKRVVQAFGRRRQNRATVRRRKSACGGNGKYDGEHKAACRRIHQLSADNSRGVHHKRNNKQTAV